MDGISPAAPTDTAQEMDAEQLTGAQMVLRVLQEAGVDTVFGYPGGAVLPIYDALFQQNAIRHILVRHEQGAVHAAEGYARSTGKLGVVLVTSGPGATNAVTGLADALMDSIPVLCLTGQVPTHLIGNDAFQEADTTGITRPITKHNYLVKSVEQMEPMLRDAIYVATHGRPGPVVVDIPKNVQFEEVAYRGANPAPHKTYRPQTEPDPARIAEAADLLAGAKRPIFYVGGGVINSGPQASESLIRLVRETGYPITQTLMGLGAYPAGDKQFLGMLGMHGTYEANLAMHDCDVMVAVGARFDDRVTGRLDAFSPGSKKIHIDIDPSSINKNVPVDVPVIADAGAALDALLAEWHRRGAQTDREALARWWDRIETWRGVNCLRYEQEAAADAVIKPQYALERLRQATRHLDPIITTEVGQHQMWAAQFLPFEKPNLWLTSGGLGTMGYGLPAAIGAQLGNPDRLVIDVAGEASILMNIQELSTAMQYRLPVKVFILNNEWMGMVRQWQQLLHGERYSESYSAALPDFVKLADAFGGVGLRAQRRDQVDDVIAEMLAVTDRPCVVDMRVDPKENCFPMIPGGAAHNEILLGPNDQQDPNRAEEGMILV